MRAETIIQLKNVRYELNGRVIIDDANCAIKRGAYVGMIGPNGGGKTTLLRLMLGLIKPARGTIKLFGQEIQTFRDWTKVGYLSQRAASVDLRFPVTVEEIVRQGRIGRIGLFKPFRDQDYAAVEKAMKLTNIFHLRHRVLENLSGGERQRVLITRALASEPEVLFLDEPLAWIDAASQEKFYKFLKELNQNSGLTIVFVSHDIHALASQVTQILSVNRTIIYEGPPDQGLKKESLGKLYGQDHLIH